MEKEKVWVECMYNTNGASLVLTVGKQYLATIIDEHTYIMENDKGELDWFSKNRFKVIGINDELWVECVNDDLLCGKDLTIGKVYKVKEFCYGCCYCIQNNYGDEAYYHVNKFKIVNKTSNLKIIKTNGRKSIKEIISGVNPAEIEIGYWIEGDKILTITEFKTQSTCKKKVYTYINDTGNLNEFIEDVNKMCLKYNLKIELDQPKYKINCDKLYTKEEADKLRESGIDLVEVNE